GAEVVNEDHGRAGGNRPRLAMEQVFEQRSAQAQMRLTAHKGRNTRRFGSGGRNQRGSRRVPIQDEGIEPTPAHLVPQLRRDDREKAGRYAASLGAADEAGIIARQQIEIPFNEVPEPVIDQSTPVSCRDWTKNEVMSLPHRVIANI